MAKQFNQTIWPTILPKNKLLTREEFSLFLCTIKMLRPGLDLIYKLANRMDMGILELHKGGKVEK